MWSIEVFKIAIPALITLAVAAGGWLITRAFNNSQQKIASEKNKADVEIAKVNTAIRFLELFEKIPETEPEKRADLIAVSVPILPPDFAFDLAVSHIDHAKGAVDALFARYRSDSFRYLEPHLARGPIFRTAEFVQDVEFDALPSKLLDFLSARSLNVGIEDYLFFATAPNTSMRTKAIINYFYLLRSESDQAKNEGAGFVRHLNLVKRVLEDKRTASDVKRAVALASCMAFLNGWGDERDVPMLEFAAEFFWDGIDVSSGEIPMENSLPGFVYRHAFHYRNAANSRIVALPVRDKLSSQLLARIKQVQDFNDLGWENVRLIIYGYMAYTPRDTDSPFTSFLAPDDAVQAFQMVLNWAKTPERRMQLGRELNSLSGSAIFRNLERSPKAQRAWSESTLQFYERHYSKDWYPAKIMYDIASKFPDLRTRINQNAQNWGFSPIAEHE